MRTFKHNLTSKIAEEIPSNVFKIKNLEVKLSIIDIESDKNWIEIKEENSNVNKGFIKSFMDERSNKSDKHKPIFKLSDDNMYHTCDDIIGPFSLGDMLYHKPCVNSGDFSIYEVLNDSGVSFKVGDYTRIGKILEFRYLRDGNIVAKIHNPDLIQKEYNINNLVKEELPLVKTIYNYKVHTNLTYAKHYFNIEETRKILGNGSNYIKTVITENGEFSIGDNTQYGKIKEFYLGSLCMTPCVLFESGESYPVKNLELKIKKQQNVYIYQLKSDVTNGIFTFDENGMLINCPDGYSHNSKTTIDTALTHPSMVIYSVKTVDGRTFTKGDSVITPASDSYCGIYDFKIDDKEEIICACTHSFLLQQKNLNFFDVAKPKLFVVSDDNEKLYHSDDFFVCYKELSGDIETLKFGLNLEKLIKKPIFYNGMLISEFLTKETFSKYYDKPIVKCFKHLQNAKLFCEKNNEVLGVTMDGKDQIRIGSTFYTVDEKRWKVQKVENITKIDFETYYKNSKNFSSENNTNEYIKRNEPKYSLNDFEKMKNNEEPWIKFFKNLVK